MVILWTGGLSYAPYRSLSIFKFYCSAVGYEFITLLVAISGPKKSRFQGPPLQTALVMDSPPSHPNPYVPPHINNRYINSYYDLFVHCTKGTLIYTEMWLLKWFDEPPPATSFSVAFHHKKLIRSWQDSNLQSSDS
jgi:hypothetical protein